MKNWKTTVCGAISAAAALVMLSPESFPAWAVLGAKFVLAGGLAGMGIAAKDSNVTGGTVQQ